MAHPSSQPGIQIRLLPRGDTMTSLCARHGTSEVLPPLAQSRAVSRPTSIAIRIASTGRNAFAPSRFASASERENGSSPPLVPRPQSHVASLDPRRSQSEPSFEIQNAGSASRVCIRIRLQRAGSGASAAFASTAVCVRSDFTRMLRTACPNPSRDVDSDSQRALYCGRDDQRSTWKVRLFMVRAFPGVRREQENMRVVRRGEPRNCTWTATLTIST